MKYKGKQKYNLRKVKMTIKLTIHAINIRDISFMIYLIL